MTKINIGSNVFTQPMPVTLLGTKDEDKPNFMTLAGVTRANANPPIFLAAVNKFNLSNQNIMENKTFSINFPSEEMISKTEYCGLVSGRKTDKSIFLRFFMGN